MKRIKIIREGIITNQARFETEEMLNDWLQKEILNLSFGHPERILTEQVNEPTIGDDLKAKATLVEDFELDGIAYKRYTIPAEFTYEIEDITAQVEAEDRRLNLIAQGEKTAQACKNAFNLIAGYNQYRALSSAQKDQMAALFAPVVQALKIYERPSMAKALVTAIEPDGVLVTAEMKADMLEVLKDF